MHWFDYREKLGVGFSDDEKFKHLLANRLNFFDTANTESSQEEYRCFCDMTGSNVKTDLFKSSSFLDFTFPDQGPESIGAIYQKDTFRIIREHTLTIKEFLSFYIAFVNTRSRTADTKKYKKLLRDNLKKSRIPFEIHEDADGVFVFPQGAKELDNALVSDVLLWLKNYPKTHKTFTIALKQYADGVYNRDIADNLRKALETFLQEFLGYEKNLKNNKEEVGNYLKANNAEGEMANMFVNLLDCYDKLNNKTAKHNDKTDVKFLEFLLYQTGIFIRMLIVVEQAATK